MPNLFYVSRNVSMDSEIACTSKCSIALGRATIQIATLYLSTYCLHESHHLELLWLAAGIMISEWVKFSALLTLVMNNSHFIPGLLGQKERAKAAVLVQKWIDVNANMYCNHPREREREM